MGWYGDTDNGRVCWFIVLAPKELILLTVIAGIIPLVVVVVLYSIILYRALNKIIQLKEADANIQSPQGNENSLRLFRGGSSSVSAAPNPQIDGKKPMNTSKAPSKWKAIKVVMFTTGSFVITWAPYFIASLMYGYCYDKQSPRCNTLRILIASPLAILGFTNSLINPIIYAWWHKGFRTFIKRKCQAIKLKRKATEDITTANSSRSASTGHSALGSKTSSASSSTNLSTVPLDTENPNLNTKL